MSGAGGYWLEDWVNEFDIVSRDKFFQAIKSPTVIKSLFNSILNKKLVEPGTHTGEFPPYSVLTGRHFDLSGSYHHRCANCLNAELSNTIAQTMHFFERIVVSGPRINPLGLSLQHKEKRIREKALFDLWPFVEFILHVNKIEARDTLIFAPKSEAYCDDCFRMVARTAGIHALESEEQSQEIVDKLLSESKFIIMRDRTGQWEAAVEHPYLGGTYHKQTMRKRRPTRKELVAELFRDLSENALHDISTSQHYRLPLFEGFQARWLDISENHEVTAEDIALHLQVPTLVGLPLENLVEIQRENREGIIRMQRTIAAAISEAMSKHEDNAPKRIASLVQKEFIEPELADIENRLRSKYRTLGKKLSATAAIATTTTSVGLLTAIPLVIATGVGIAATSLTQLYKYFDDKSEIETSDLYFLSKIKRIQH